MKRFYISHQLHRSIDDEFRRAGGVIAFPQRDVHLDQIGPLEVNVFSNQAGQAAEIDSKRQHKKDKDGFK